MVKLTFRQNWAFRKAVFLKDITQLNVHNIKKLTEKLLTKPSSNASDLILFVFPRNGALARNILPNKIKEFRKKGTDVTTFRQMFTI